MRLHLDILSHRVKSHPAITLRRRWPASFPDEATAIEQCIKLLEMHSDIAAFILVPDGLQAINDAAFEERTITRAMAARRSRKTRKAREEVQP